MLSFNISSMIVVYDPSCCFNICLIWSVHVVDLHNVCDPSRVRSFRGMWSWPLMVIHSVDLYNFMNWLGPSIMCIGVLNVGRVRPLFFLELYKFDPCWVRPLFGLVQVCPWLGPSTLWTMLTLGGIHPLCGLVSLTLVGSVHFVDRVDPWWDPSTLL